jgi:phosphopantetheinyl transferase (holo-ACP synthase)
MSHIPQTPSFIVHRYKVSECPTILIMVQISEVESYRENSEFLSGFSAQEIRLVQDTPKGVHSLAARYAAKRAAEILIGQPWQTFEVMREPDHPPQLHHRDEEASSLATQYSLSLTHDEPYAAAYLAPLSDL